MTSAFKGTEAVILSYHPAVMFPIVIKLLEFFKNYWFDLIDLLI